MIGAHMSCHAMDVVPWMPCHAMRCQPTALHPYEPTAARGHLEQNPGFRALMKDPELGKVKTAIDATVRYFVLNVHIRAWCYGCPSPQFETQENVRGVKFVGCTTETHGRAL